VSGPLAFDPEGRLVAMGEESFVVVERSGGLPLRRAPLGMRVHTSPPAAALSSDGAMGAVSGWVGQSEQLRVWDLRSGELMLRRRVPRMLRLSVVDPISGRTLTRVARGVWRLALSPDGRRLAVGGAFTLWVCSTRTGRRSHLLLCGGERLRSLAFSPDGALLAA